MKKYILALSVALMLFSMSSCKMHQNKSTTADNSNITFESWARNDLPLKLKNSDLKHKFDYNYEVVGDTFSSYLYDDVNTSNMDEHINDVKTASALAYSWAIDAGYPDAKIEIIYRDGMYGEEEEIKAINGNIIFAHLPSYVSDAKSLLKSGYIEVKCKSYYSEDGLIMKDEYYYDNKLSYTTFYEYENGFLVKKYNYSDSQETTFGSKTKESTRIKEINTYDSNGNLTYHKESDSDETIEIYYTYEDGYLSSEVYSKEVKNDDNGIDTIIEKTKYDKKGGIIYNSFYSPGEQYEYQCNITYDSNGNIIKEVLIDPFDNDSSSDIFEYKYDSYGRKTKEVNIYYGEIYRVETWDYTDNGRKITHKIYIGSETNENLRSVDVKIYNDCNQLIEENSSSTDNDIEYSTIYEYNGEKLDKESYVYRSAEEKTIFKTRIYEYDDYGNKTLEIEENEFGEQKLKEYCTYEYYPSKKIKIKYSYGNFPRYSYSH